MRPLSLSLNLHLSLDADCLQGRSVRSAEAVMRSHSGGGLFDAGGPALRLWTPDAEPPPPPLTPERDNRISHPVVTPPAPVVRPALPALPPPAEPRRRRWVLRSVFILKLWRLKRDELATASWYDYRSLVAKWEAWWTQREGRPSRGPDVCDITDAGVRAFFDAQAEWRSSRTWEKYRDLFASLLRTVLVRSEGNRAGPKGSEALLTELPWFEIPAERFFQERRRKLEAQPAKPGGHRPSRDTLLTVAEIDRVIEACQMATFPVWDGCDAQSFWRAFFAVSWTYGPRLRNLLMLPRTTIDWQRATCRFTETKKGHEVWVPLPPAVLSALSAINRGERTGLLPIPPGQRANLDRNFYPTYKTIWQWSGVPLRMPHQLRANCISHWKQHSPEWRKWVTGHSRKGDVQDEHYVILGDKFRDAVLTFPQPPSLLR